MTKLALFVAPGSCSRVPTIALEQIGVPFETRLVRFMKGEHRSPDYLKVNPKGKVPALLVDGEALTENVAILDYLADTYPQAGLLPPAATGVARAHRIADLCFCAATLHPIVTRIRLPQMFAGGPDTAGLVYKSAVEAMHPFFQLVEERVSGGRWWYGETWSVVDAYLFWVWFRVTGAAFPVEPYPAFADHARRMEARPAVQRALAREADQEAQLKAEGLFFQPPPPPSKAG